MRTYLAAVILALAALFLHSAVAHDAAPLAAALKRQADAWDVAIVTKNREAISANMEDSFFQIGNDGSTATKVEFVDNLMSADLTIEPYAVDDFKIRIYGNTALINGATLMHGTERGKPFTTHYRFTDTYVKEGNVWRVVNVQTTRIQ